MAVVDLRGITKVFPNGVEALASIDLTVDEGEFLTLVGPSGSGKSTLLRIIAGLESPTSGTVSIGGRDVTHQEPRARDVAMVFQDPALYPYLSVFDNLAFGLRARGGRRAELKTRVEAASASLGLDGLLRRRPQTLSGGQRQRVALGRAIVRRPAVFLFDEPLSRLDAPLRASVRADLIDLHRRVGATMIFVTHDQGEALATGDRVGLIERGRIVQVGTPESLYRSPATRFVATFIGNPPMNVIPCRVLDGPSEDACRVGVDGLGPEASFLVYRREWLPTLRSFLGRRIDLGVRPDDVILGSDENRFNSDPSLAWLSEPFEMRRVEFLGHETICTVGLGPHSVSARQRGPNRAKAGEPRIVGFDPAGLNWFDPETGLTLMPDNAV